MYAFSEMADHMSMLREVYAHLLDLFPCMAGIEDCGSLFTHLKNKRIAAEAFLVRLFLAAQQALGTQESGNVFRALDREIRRAD